MTTKFSLFLITLGFISLNAFSRQSALPGISNYLVTEQKSFNNMEYALVANESFPGNPKFELDFFCCNPDLNAAKEMVWLSVTTASAEAMKSGVYKFSSKSINDRGAFTFSGSWMKEQHSTPVVDGSLQLELKDADMTAEYDLLLKDGTKLTGRYKGRYLSEDRRTIITKTN